ncbi:MAG: hypothetical protein H6953_19405 [Chromatiaceae bacterium]|nr:hypothetical protein [Chromatiaceae bacterium]
MSHRWAPVLAALSEAQHVLLVGHVNPDADALAQRWRPAWPCTLSAARSR